ncbi:hypothetical protein NQ317_001752 [Molorchus minor]|uniref:Endonuclease n=1 Tax=Molorchus minor TaxID=1323400 RepID=A0ABQ9IXM5_9CUCU|nr:hypothetical protein NQ317_001752 [Molorchus minor]
MEEIKKKHRKVIRASFTKTANELDMLLSATAPVPLNDIEISWECLKPKFENLRICDNELFECLLENATEEQLLAEVEGCDGYIKRFTELNLRCEKVFQHKPAVDAVSVGSRISSNAEASPGEVATTGKRKFKLPRIEFKHYDGNIRDWLAFWAQFKKIDEDASIDNSDKIEYLIQATVSGSRARQLVESFPAVGDNYAKIIECMKARFGRDDLQIEVYVRELLRLVLKNAMTPSKLEICKLYDQIETQLRALDTLGITSDKYAAMLYPLIESCLPQELLRIWQRSTFSSSASSSPPSEIGSTQSVENEQRISLACEGFGLAENYSNMKSKSNDEQSKKKPAKHSPTTAAGLVNTDNAKCIFCTGSHGSDVCFKARKMTLEERRNILSQKKACFRCLKIGHLVRKCRSRLKCILCEQSHVPLMCQTLDNDRKPSDDTAPQNAENVVVKDQALTNQTDMHVFLQTLRVTIKGSENTRIVRALVDTGSQRSYILKSTVLDLGLEHKRVEKIVHCLFGGSKSTNSHRCYDVTMVNGKYTNTFEVLDQPYICNEVTSVFYGPWMHELSRLKINVSDYDNHGPIELLLGADVAGLLYTGRHHNLQCGLVAIETWVGWTIMGKISAPKSRTNDAMSVLSLFASPSITDLWQLDVLGIQEPTEKKSKEEMAEAAKELFLKTITADAQGRYEVRLPWLDGHPPLTTNYDVTKKRLNTTLQKLQRDELLCRYNAVFQEWESLNIIERTDGDTSQGHFIPHRAVVKEGSTTAIRPVFDASAHEKNRPSLNQCLEKGPNLIELIPTLLIKFREFKIGVISDIKKAFLQIGLHERDRDFLKFIWVDEKGQEIIFRHRRVVFGVNCSPFLLGATIDYHLKKCLEKNFYVDNCVTSVPDEEAVNTFISESVAAMAEGQFELRGWEFSGNTDDEDHHVSVLGLAWFPKQDVLTISHKYCHWHRKFFDPIGFTAPTTLVPKLLLQGLWEKQISWDTPVDNEIETAFKRWASDLPYLLKIRIPRWISMGGPDIQDITIHTFCDASQKAYAAVVFCRIVKDDQVSVYLLAAKSRVAPLRRLTIPRLELMGATIGVRLYAQVEKDLGCNCNSIFWSDSSTVIAWVQRNEEWGTFVWNRVSEIRRITSPADWRHISGSSNPADLPSRGCTPKQLLESKWWEGAELVISEFIHNTRYPKDKRKGDLTVDEIEQGEIFVFSSIQKEMFSSLEDKRINCLNPYRDTSGLMRLKSRVSNRIDTDSYRFPIVLPDKHPAIRSLIMDTHRRLCHIGTQGLLAQMREKYWILGGRRAIRSVVQKCVICRKLSSKAFAVDSPPLPFDRVRDASVFEITGVDFAGPLYLKTGEKAWICLFTCAVFRAVHLELTLSLSTSKFLQVLRRFVARRGRPKIMYSDNGTNFRGTDNAFADLNWEQIMRETSTQRIIWRFNPPSSPWWGGFFERLIGLVKQLLRRVLGRASLYYEELLTVICDCEAVVNSRPLTYVSDDANDLVALTPAMFLRDQPNADMPDCDEIDKASLSRKVRNQQRLRDDLRKRFRLEYLGQLKLLCEKRSNVSVKLGDVVLIENDSVKRIEWPIGRVVELLPGKDGCIRLVRVKTVRGELLRPVQRLIPLEGDGDFETKRNEVAVMEGSSTASGCKAKDDDVSGSARVHQSRVTAEKVKVARNAGVQKSRIPEKVRITRAGRLWEYVRKRFQKPGKQVADHRLDIKMAMAEHGVGDSSTRRRFLWSDSYVDEVQRLAVVRSADESTNHCKMPLCIRKAFTISTPQTRFSTKATCERYVVHLLRLVESGVFRHATEIDILLKMLSNLVLRNGIHNYIQKAQGTTATRAAWT